MADFFASIIAFINSTEIPAQIRAVDAKGLFSNAWFLVPFLAYLLYCAIRKAITTLVMVGLTITVWMFMGSSYMQGLFVGDHIQVNKILPIAGFGVLVIAVAVYFIFMRSD